MKTWFAIALLVVVAETKSIVAPSTAKVEQAADDAAEVEVVTDLAIPVAASDEPQKVALELMRLQQELGGSVVTDQFPVTPAEPAVGQSLWQDDPEEQIQVLQEASRLLEEAAFSLERLDLYRQADDLRSSAERLRTDARRARMGRVGGGS